MNGGPTEGAINTKSEKSAPTEEIEPELECVVCNDILYQPVSINCGHSFCKECLINVLRTKPQCPLCRTPTFLQESNLKQNVIIQSLIENKYPEHIKRRKANQVVISEEDNIDSRRADSTAAAASTVEQPLSLPPILVFNLQEDKQFLPQSVERIKIKCDWNIEFFQHICPDKRVICLNTAKPPNFPNVNFIVEVQRMENQPNGEVVMIVRVLNRILVKELQQIECDNPEFLQQFNISKPFNMTVARAEEYNDQSISDIPRLEELLKPIQELVRTKINTIMHNSPNALALLFSRFPNIPTSNLLAQRSFAQVSQETLLYVSILNMDAETKKRALETKNIMERMVILQQTAADLDQYNESAKIFNLTGSSGHKHSLLTSLAPILFVVMAMILMKYLGNH